MVAVPIVMGVMPVVVRGARGRAHCDPARLAKLPVLRFHAGGDLGHVGNDIGTKPHRIRCARLTRGIADLSDRAFGATKQQSEQGNRAGQVNDPHGYPLGFGEFWSWRILVLANFWWLNLLTR